MKLTPLHERLLADILDLGSPYPLVLTGGYAVQAHGLVERFSRDLDVATEIHAPMDDEQGPHLFSDVITRGVSGSGARPKSS
nr:nucleotidyl transferase AbiEii/AbiGii toxin family protein [Streptomyces albus]